MAVTITQLCLDAAHELNVPDIDDVQFPPNLAQFFLLRLNRLLDAWNADHGASYAQQFVTYTLTPALSPHTIGPSGATFTTPGNRPVTIDGASLIYPSTPASAYMPINLRDAQWWSAQQVPGLSTQDPTDLYYEPTWPNGSLYFWPVPNAAKDVELQFRRVLLEVALPDTFSLPPGYQDAITLTLAEMCQRSVGKPSRPDLRADAAMARARIFAVNIGTPTLCTQDSGMPSVTDSPNFPTWNYLTGS